MKTMAISKLPKCFLAYFFVSRVLAFQNIVPTVPGDRLASPRPFLAAIETDASPIEHVSHTLSIEYCSGCRWMLKSFWIAQELLTTFEADLDAVTILPSSNKGIFSVRLNGNQLLWDRKEQGGFPSPKGLKQIVRDMVEPEKFLGHSDTPERQTLNEGDVGTDAVEGFFRVETNAQPEIPDAPQPAVTITYCTGCRWLLRGAYFGQELLTTFGEEIKSVTLVPSRPPAKGGAFVSR